MAIHLSCNSKSNPLPQPLDLRSSEVAVTDIFVSPDVLAGGTKLKVTIIDFTEEQPHVVEFVLKIQTLTIAAIITELKTALTNFADISLDTSGLVEIRPRPRFAIGLSSSLASILGLSDHNPVSKPTKAKHPVRAGLLLSGSSLRLI